MSASLPPLSSLRRGRRGELIWAVHGNAAPTDRYPPGKTNADKQNDEPYKARGSILQLQKRRSQADHCQLAHKASQAARRFVRGHRLRIYLWLRTLGLFGPFPLSLLLRCRCTRFLLVDEVDGDGYCGERNSGIREQYGSDLVPPSTDSARADNDCLPNNETHCK